MNPIVAGIIREFVARRPEGRPPTLAEARLMLHDQLLRSHRQEIKPQDATRRGRHLCDELRRFVREHCSGSDIVNVIADHATRTGGLPLTSVITHSAKSVLDRDTAISRDEHLVTVVAAMLICRIFDQLDERTDQRAVCW